MISVAANVAVIAGVIFAFVQIGQSKQFERRRTAIDATAPTRSPEFLTAYTKLLDAYQGDPTMPYSSSLSDDLTYVMSVYDNIAILCLSGLADENFVKQRSFDAMTTLEPILDAMKWRPESRRNFDGLLNDLMRLP